MQISAAAAAARNYGDDLIALIAANDARTAAIEEALAANARAEQATATPALAVVIANAQKDALSEHLELAQVINTDHHTWH